MAPPTMPPESPVFSAPGPTEISAPLEVAQAPPAEGNAFKAGAERRAAEQGGTHNLWWLAGLGVVTLVISAGLFVFGRRKARRA
jgi:LPXTG-motif cell wall-anchored protein